jgi:o-succinylbenzoate synthase
MGDRGTGESTTIRALADLLPEIDESVATFAKIQSAYAQGWRGIYTVKPGIAGFPWRLSEFITQHQLDVVFSSVMETSVGRDAAFRLATELKMTRSMGFGVDDWFAEVSSSVFQLAV